MNDEYKSGTVLGAELYKLYQSGNLMKDTIAKQFTDAIGASDRADSSSPFMRTGDLGIGPMGPHTTITSMTALYTSFLGDAKSNVVATGDALIRAADLIAATDEAAAAEFGRLKREAGE